MSHHACEIFEIRGIPCPFGEFEEEDDDDDDDRRGRRVMFPAKGDKDAQNRVANVVDVFANTVPYNLARGRLGKLQEAGNRFPEVGELIPNLTRNLQDLPAQGIGGAFAGAAALALGEVLRRSQGKGSPLQLQRQVAGAFGRQETGFSGRGRGGFHVNAAANLKSLFTPRRKLRQGGFGQFTMEGLGDLI